MRIKLLIFTLLALATLASCKKWTTESGTIVTYTITASYSPKPFRVTLQAPSGQVYEKLVVSKNCKRWQEVIVGTTVPLYTEIVRSGEERQTVIRAKSLCPRDE